MLAPIPMTPAYRCGKSTPWGGDDLRRLYGKETPSAITGESLECSAIPGLESRAPDGETLPALILRYGARLTGKDFCGEFPLLLKLLSARDTLSVQVHPGDEYARRVENKLGKSEAWIILDAKPGAQIVYGVRKGVTKEELYAASQRGKDVEALLRFVPARPGDIFNIPSGTVHAIGDGITLYEIQQSSDVTYRFYDWDRRDEKGNQRELHIEKAVEVTDATLQMSAACLPQNGGRALSTPKFTVDYLPAGRDHIIEPCESAFGILTAFGEGSLSWADGEIKLRPGRTYLLPADGYALSLRLSGFALLSRPAMA